MQGHVFKFRVKVGLNQSFIGKKFVKNQKKSAFSTFQIRTFFLFFWKILKKV